MTKCNCPLRQTWISVVRGCPHEATGMCLCAYMYSKSCRPTVASVKEARQQLFTQGSRSLENIPYTDSTSKDHSYRLPIYESRQPCHQVVPDFSNCGWEFDGDRWLSLRKKLADGSQSSSLLLHKCSKAGLRCTSISKCEVGFVNMKLLTSN